jgi:hypothetical protein
MQAEAASMIRLSCSPKAWRIVKGMRTPLEMWNTLQTSLDTTGSYICKQDILRQSRDCRPKDGETLKAYFTNLSDYRIQLDHTDDAITDADFRMPIFTLLPSHYAMLLLVLKHTRPLPRPEEAMHDLFHEETAASLTKELADASKGAALFSQCGATMAMAVVDAVGAVDAVNTVETVDPQTPTKVSAPIAKLTTTLQLHAESAN